MTIANRMWIDKQYTLVKGRAELYCAVTVGAAGAVTLVKWNYPQMAQGTAAPARTYTAAPTTGGGTTFPTRYAQGAEGIFSVARTGTGLWTVTLSDGYQRTLGIGFYSSLAGGLSTIVAVHENTTITNMTATGGSVIGLALMSSTATAADPASGERINLHFSLQMSTAP